MSKLNVFFHQLLNLGHIDRHGRSIRGLLVFGDSAYGLPDPDGAAERQRGLLPPCPGIGRWIKPGLEKRLVDEDSVLHALGLQLVEV